VTKLVIKFGKNGSFLACKQYPECTFTSEFDRQDDGSVKVREEERVGRDCSECDDGELIYKTGRFGRFVGCTNYPTCKNTEPVKTGVSCPKCDPGSIIEKQSRRGKIFYACDQYPKCDHAQWDQPIPVACTTCEHKHIDRKVKGRDGGRVVLICPSCKAEMTEAELGLGAAATP
jgi:DNA topoisomerase-1